MSGTFVAVVGASGSGKDSLIDYARRHLPEEHMHFVRRVVTRAAEPGSEDHDSLTDEAFRQADAEGRFALSWQAHGLCYGLPLTLEDALAQGRVVVANLSREVIPALVARYPGALVVEVAAAPDVIAARLSRRGRETPQSIEARMSRDVSVRLPASTVHIDNSGPLEFAGARFTDLLKDLAGLPAA